jgi:DNA-binding PadR family transcriptional regulator
MSRATFYSLEEAGWLRSEWDEGDANCASDWLYNPMQRLYALTQEGAQTLRILKNQNLLETRGKMLSAYVFRAAPLALNQVRRARLKQAESA